jgi:hypothetical protein
MKHYSRLSTAEKERRHLDRMREPPIRCPQCETAVQPDELLVHQAERCPGKPEPHPLSKWVTWGEARRLGVPAMSLSRWTRKGWVRVRHEAQQERKRGRGRPAKRRYHLRDLVQVAAGRRITNTRVTKSSTTPNKGR